MSNNYIVINGKKAELTQKQLKLLGLETRKNPFERVEKYSNYYRVTELNMVDEYVENCDYTDSHLRECVNYFNDKQFAEQVALHQLLYRKLLKFAYDNGFEDTAEWNDVNKHWCLEYLHREGCFITQVQYSIKPQGVCFSSQEGARRAVQEIVEPFMKEHPEFVW